MIDDGHDDVRRLNAVATRDSDNARDALCLMTSTETRLSVLAGMSSICRCINVAVKSNREWERWKAFATARQTTDDLVRTLMEAICEGDFVLVRIATRKLETEKRDYRCSFEFVMPMCAESVDGESCARTWIETTVKHDPDWRSRLSERVDGVRGFVKKEGSAPHRPTGCVNCRAGTTCRYREVLSAIVRSSVVWAIDDWKEAVAHFFVRGDSEEWCDPLATYHGMKSRRTWLENNRKRQFGGFERRSGMFALDNDSTDARETVFGLPKSHVWEESVREVGSGMAAARFPTLPHACLSLPDWVTKSEEALNPRRAAMAADVAKRVISKSYPKAGRTVAWFDEPLAAWGTVVGQFGNVGAMVEYAKTMTKASQTHEVERKTDSGRRTPFTRDLRRDADAEDGFRGAFTNSWMRALATGAFATGRPAIVREFLNSMREIVPNELKSVLKFGNDDDVAVAAKSSNRKKSGTPTANATDENPGRAMLLAHSAVASLRAGTGTTWSEQQTFSPLVRLLTLAYCDRYIPPDRVDVQLLALETLNEFVDFAVPVGKRSAVFEELCVSLALNCKWTMVRLICQRVLHSSWSPHALPMTGCVSDKPHSGRLAVCWMNAHGWEVRANGTDTVRWMLDIVASTFST